MINYYENFMRECIALAVNGEGKVSPNPLVGAVVLDKNGNIAGRGWHQKYGEAHAEVNALKQAGDRAKDGTIFVNLEPCSHYGKTPPCADLIVEKGIKKLVVGMVDPNPLVSGRGIKKCEDAGIEVLTGVLEKDCQKLNEVFVTNQREKRIFCAIKTAMTLDGKVASRTGDSKWVTSEKAREFVQTLRNKYDAVLTGSKTVLSDNPQMNCRIQNLRNPVRVVVDTNLKCGNDLHFFNEDGTKIYVAVGQNIPADRRTQFSPNVEFIDCPLKQGKIDLNFLFEKLYEKGIRSILVEAGGTLNGALLQEKLVDKIYAFIAPKVLADKEAKNWAEGLRVEKMENCIKLNFEELKFYGPDLLVETYVNR